AEGGDISVRQLDLREKSIVSPIPVTVPIREEDRQSVSERLQRDPNILVFGSFRRHKGFEEACRAALILEMIKSDKWNDVLPRGFGFPGRSMTLSQYLTVSDPLEQRSLKQSLKDTKVIFAGSADPNFPHVYRQIISTLLKCPNSMEVYPDPRRIIMPGESSPMGLVRLRDSCNRDTIRRIRSQTFISDNELAVIAKRCKYGYKGDQTGMRDNASGIISTLAQGCITYCASSFNTDDCYRRGGEYADAIDLDATPGHGMFPGNPKAEVLLKSIAGRESDQHQRPADGGGSINRNTLELMDKLLQERFGGESIFRKHMEVYAVSPQEEMSLQSPSHSGLPAVDLGDEVAAERRMVLSESSSYHDDEVSVGVDLQSPSHSGLPAVDLDGEVAAGHTVSSESLHHDVEVPVRGELPSPSRSELSVVDLDGEELRREDPPLREEDRRLALVKKEKIPDRVDLSEEQQLHQKLLLLVMAHEIIRGMFEKDPVLKRNFEELCRSVMCVSSDYNPCLQQPTPTQVGPRGIVVR
ncbi:hypothetical protein ACFL0U_04105, partial [Pseudomonadota bacterium]